MSKPFNLRPLGIAGLIALTGCAAVAHAQSANQFPQRVCDVRDHGATGARIWFDTKAFQAAIESCAKAGGGTVPVPSGEWLIEPIFLRIQVDYAVSVWSNAVRYAERPKRTTSC